MKNEIKQHIKQTATQILEQAAYAIGDVIFTDDYVLSNATDDEIVAALREAFAEFDGFEEWQENFGC